MPLSTLNTIQIRAAEEGENIALYKQPEIQLIIQANSESEQLVCTVSFLGASKISSASSQVSITLSELEAISTGCEDAYNLLLNTIEQRINAHLEDINTDAEITYTART